MGSINVAFWANLKLGTLTYGILMSFLSSIFDFSGPVFLNLIVTYVQEDNRDLQYGIILISGVILSRILQALTYGQSNLYTVIQKINTYSLGTDWNQIQNRD